MPPVDISVAYLCDRYHSLFQVRRHEQKTGRRDHSVGVDSSSHHSGTGQDSGFGSDSARIRIVQIEQHCGTSHHCIARPSQKSTITKNLNFIPFDIFLTASRLSVMTYACSSPPKTLPSSSSIPSTLEKKEPGNKVKKTLQWSSPMSQPLTGVHVFIIIPTIHTSKMSFKYKELVVQRF